MTPTMSPAQQLAQQNLLQRQAVLANAVEMTQNIYSAAIQPTVQTVINIPPRNVGLIKGFIVEVSGTITNTAATPLTRTNFGSANIVQQFTFTDLNNQVRINVPGYYLATLNSARQGWAFGGVYQNNLAMGYGNNFNVNAGAATVAISTDVYVKHVYYVPLSYSGDDLRGSIYAGIINATMNLQITLNNTPCIGATTELQAIFKGNAASTWKTGTAIQIDVYQVYLDQLPIINGNPVVPVVDLNTVYELKQTTLNGISAGQDKPIPYANFRDFLSTFIVYDNNGTFNAGTDINYFSLTSANFTNLFKYSPNIAALKDRQVFMADLPLGTYYFDHRSRPINTIAFGNMELNVNTNSAPAGARIIAAYEAFSQQAQLSSSVTGALGGG